MIVYYFQFVWFQYIQTRSLTHTHTYTVHGSDWSYWGIYTHTILLVSSVVWTRNNLYEKWNLWCVFFFTHFLYEWLPAACLSLFSCSACTHAFAHILGVYYFPLCISSNLLCVSCVLVFFLFFSLVMLLSIDYFYSVLMVCVFVKWIRIDFCLFARCFL